MWLFAYVWLEVKHAGGFMVFVFWGVMILALCGTNMQARVGIESMAKNGFSVTSSAFTEGNAIPKRYTCDGENISPDLAWTGVPEGTQSFAIIVDDPDAPSKTWVHWIVYNMPATITQLSGGVNTAQFATGLNDFGNTQYGGPCPPSGIHRYRFTVYALDILLPKEAGISKQKLLALMDGHILAQNILTGVYARTKQ